MKTHTLKILPPYFYAQIKGFKKFEIRKNDREFKVLDKIKLVEINGGLMKDCEETGNHATLLITYILNSEEHSPFEGLEPGYCIMSTDVIESTINNK